MSEKKAADAAGIPQCESEHVRGKGSPAAQVAGEGTTSGSQGARDGAAKDPDAVAYRRLRGAGLSALVLFILLIFVLAVIPEASKVVTVFRDEANFIGAVLVAGGGLLQLLGGTTPDTRNQVNWRPPALGWGALLVFLGGGLLALAAWYGADWQPFTAE